MIQSAIKKQQKTSHFHLFTHKKRSFSCVNATKKAKISPAVANRRKNFVQFEFTVKELDEETNLYYYGARYLDPRTSRWLTGDPAIWQGDYIPVAPTNDETRKHNQNLPGMGGIFNIVNMHAYHYAGNNPVKYLDPDGRRNRAARIPVSQQVNNIPRRYTSFHEQSAYQNIVTRLNENEALVSAIEILSHNNIRIFIDSVLNRGRYREEAMRYILRVHIAYSDVILEANREFRIEGVTTYSNDILDRYVRKVNNEMINRFYDQSSLGPYAGTVMVPRIDRATALYELNKQPVRLIPTHTSTPVGQTE